MKLEGDTNFAQLISFSIKLLGDKPQGQILIPVHVQDNV
jgi:hypothetical protein